MSDPEIYKRIFSACASGKSVIIMIDSPQAIIEQAFTSFVDWMSSNVRLVLSSSEAILVNGSYVVFRRMISRIPANHDDNYTLIVWPKDIGVDGWPV